jgi:hypothetical protein
MGLSATDWSSLRTQIRVLLKKNIPTDLSSDDPRFVAMTGMSTKWLREQWANGSGVTSCNSFAGWVAKQIGIPGTSVLARGFLDISQAEKEQTGCWISASDQQTIDLNLHPQAGDFYSGRFKTQKWGHVGIVYDYDDTSGEWTVVQGGQGGPKSKLDFIKWKKDKFDRTAINGWVDVAVYLMPNGPAFTNMPIIHPDVTF